MRDWFETTINRNLWVNIFILQCISLYWLTDVFFNDNEETQKSTVSTKILTYLVGIFVFPVIEYVTHRFDHHAEDRLPEDPTGQVQSDLFQKHIYHHVYMNSKNRVAYTLYLTLLEGLMYYTGFYICLGTVPAKLIMSSVFHGVCVYDFLHYSYHHYDLKFPF